MSIELRQAVKEDMKTIWQMQVEAFKGLLETYQDYDLSPAAEGPEKVMARFGQPFTRYFFIVADGIDVGAVRVVDMKDGSRTRISPIFIMPNHKERTPVKPREISNAVFEELKVELMISGNTSTSPRNTKRNMAITNAIKKKAIQI